MAYGDTPKASKPARRRTKHPHISPISVAASARRIYTALDRPYVGLSDGRIFDPRSGYALDWWGVGEVEIYQEPGTESTDIWQVAFADGCAVCTPNGIHVVWEPKVGQLRVQVPTAPAVRWRVHRHSPPRQLRREKQCGRRPVSSGCPLLISTRAKPQDWPPYQEPLPEERQRRTRAENAAMRQHARW